MKLFIKKFALAPVVEIVSTIAELRDNGVFVGEYIVSNPEVYDIVDVPADKIPTDFVSNKYCYTAGKGFYPNPAFSVPVDEKEMNDLKSRVSDMELAFADIISGGTN